MSRAARLVGLVGTLIGCAPEAPIPCRAMEVAEGVYLAEGDSLLGPQCDDAEQARIDLVFADEGGALFACYCIEQEISSSTARRGRPSRP